MSFQTLHHRQRRKRHPPTAAITYTRNVELGTNMLLPLQVPASGQPTLLMPPCRPVPGLRARLLAFPS
ncbi:hypothetical protein FOQG_18570 [Fusarium oxysporum f. sp. raphani 54005]|uniref:Uncharacterized protein n=1 Tax=Fusarium oxysporum f. sp. raphani 54005 TaxID=1089458 RepID=X0BE14_FUSOX|nr:hypothetical protein FOQG_18570 [Fusarium oxysporum f. sp. raphani 54005]